MRALILSRPSRRDFITPMGEKTVRKSKASTTLQPSQAEVLRKYPIFLRLNRSVIIDTFLFIYQFSLILHGYYVNLNLFLSYRWKTSLNQ